MNRKRKAIAKPSLTFAEEMLLLRGQLKAELGWWADARLQQTDSLFRGLFRAPELQRLVDQGLVWIDKNCPWDTTEKLKRAHSIIGRLQRGEPVGYDGWRGYVMPGPAFGRNANGGPK